jgi:hypothetical protein
MTLTPHIYDGEESKGTIHNSTQSQANGLHTPMIALQQSEVYFPTRVSQLHSGNTDQAPNEILVVQKFVIIKKTKLRGLSPQANYTDRATAAWQS